MPKQRHSFHFRDLYVNVNFDRSQRATETESERETEREREMTGSKAWIYSYFITVIVGELLPFQPLARGLATPTPASSCSSVFFLGLHLALVGVGRSFQPCCKAAVVILLLDWRLYHPSALSVPSATFVICCLARRMCVGGAASFAFWASRKLKMA